MWTVTNIGGDGDPREYRIVMLDKTTVGEKMKISVKARPVELDDLNNTRIYRNIQR